VFVYPDRRRQIVQVLRQSRDGKLAVRNIVALSRVHVVTRQPRVAIHDDLERLSQIVAAIARSNALKSPVLAGLCSALLATG
jgi:hypothetical protein